MTFHFEYILRDNEINLLTDIFCIDKKSYYTDQIQKFINKTSKEDLQVLFDNYYKRIDIVNAETLGLISINDIPNNKKIIIFDNNKPYIFDIDEIETYIKNLYTNTHKIYITNPYTNEPIFLHEMRYIIDVIFYIYNIDKTNYEYLSGYRYDKFLRNTHFDYLLNEMIIDHIYLNNNKNDFFSKYLFEIVNYTDTTEFKLKIQTYHIRTKSDYYKIAELIVLLSKIYDKLYIQSCGSISYINYIEESINIYYFEIIDPRCLKKRTLNKLNELSIYELKIYDTDYINIDYDILNPSIKKLTIVNSNTLISIKIKYLEELVLQDCHKIDNLFLNEHTKTYIYNCMSLIDD